jgi:hypothetical protein
MIGTDGVTDKNGHLFIYASDDAGFAAEMMGKYNLDRLLVVESKESKKVIGTISSADIMKYYSDQKQKEHEYNSPGRTRRLMVQGRRLLNKKRS